MYKSLVSLKYNYVYSHLRWWFTVPRFSSMCMSLGWTVTGGTPPPASSACCLPSTFVTRWQQVKILLSYPAVMGDLTGNPPFSTFNLCFLSCDSLSCHNHLILNAKSVIYLLNFRRLLSDEVRLTVNVHIKWATADLFCLRSVCLDLVRTSMETGTTTGRKTA